MRSQSGQALLTDSLDHTRGFWCYPGSHLEYPKFIGEYETLTNREEKFAFLQKQFNNPTKISVPKGSMIIWDSRTVHWNQ